MSDLRVFFDERKSEVDVYFNFIKHVGIDRINHKTIKFDAKTNFQTTDDLKKVLKSNCILILYNLIEGVVTNSVEFIIDKINVIKTSCVLLFSFYTLIVFHLPFLKRKYPTTEKVDSEITIE